jgi:hypothetical protein
MDRMTMYVLCKGVTAVQAAPVNQGALSGYVISAVEASPGLGLPQGSQAIQPATVDNVLNPQTQTFQAMVTCTGGGNCSATVQVMSSNDGLNWSNYLTAISVTSGASPNIVAANGSQPWEYYTAYVTAISGTNASVQCTMAS